MVEIMPQIRFLYDILSLAYLVVDVLCHRMEDCSERWSINLGCNLIALAKPNDIFEIELQTAVYICIYCRWREEEFTFFLLVVIRANIIFLNKKMHYLVRFLYRYFLRLLHVYIGLKRFMLNRNACFYGILQDETARLADVHSVG